MFERIRGGHFQRVTKGGLTLYTAGHVTFTVRRRNILYTNLNFLQRFYRASLGTSSTSFVPVSPPVHFEGAENRSVFSSGRPISEKHLSEWAVRDQNACAAEPRIRLHGAAVPGLYKNTFYA